MTDLVLRIHYRIGNVSGRGWPFTWLFRKDIALLREAATEIDLLRVNLAAADIEVRNLSNEGRAAI